MKSGHAITPQRSPGEQVERVVSRIAGVALLAFGIVVLATLLASAASIGWKMLHGAGPPPVPLTACLVLFVIGCFTASIGYRLVWRRPAHHGSLMTPGGWYTLAFVFVAIGLSISVSMIDGGKSLLQPGMIGLVLLPVGCVVAGRQARRRGLPGPRGSRN